MSDNQKPIGIFDSGLGGLTVVKSLLQRMPSENIIYLGDTARVPYGGRSREKIIAYACRDVEFLLAHDVKAIVIACNTADSMARDVIEARYPLPVVGVVEPTARAAVAKTKNGRIGVVGTRATVLSGAYENAVKRLDARVEVFSNACPLLAPLVENGHFQRGDRIAEMLVEEYLVPLRGRNIDTLVLGCTHYPLLEDIFREQLDGVSVICSGTESAGTVQALLRERGLLNPDKQAGTRQYFVSDDIVGFTRNARAYMGGSVDGSVDTVEID